MAGKRHNLAWQSEPHEMQARPSLVIDTPVTAPAAQQQMILKTCNAQVGAMLKNTQELCCCQHTLVASIFSEAAFARDVPELHKSISTS